VPTTGPEFKRLIGRPAGEKLRVGQDVGTMCRFIQHAVSVTGCRMARSRAAPSSIERARGRGAAHMYPMCLRNSRNAGPDATDARRSLRSEPFGLLLPTGAGLVCPTRYARSENHPTRLEATPRCQSLNEDSGPKGVGLAFIRATDSAWSKCSADHPQRAQPAAANTDPAIARGPRTPRPPAPWPRSAQPAVET
jgi:hypothetical protein